MSGWMVYLPLHAIFDFSYYKIYIGGISVMGKTSISVPEIYIDKELQRISRESLAQIGEKGIMFKFPTMRGCNSTVLALKEPKTKTSVRKVFLPRAVAEMLVERRKTIEELKELLGDEYRDYDLVFASTQGTPTEANYINRAFD